MCIVYSASINCFCFRHSLLSRTIRIGSFNKNLRNKDDRNKMANIVQYVIVNKEIITKLGWPLGAVIAQCCHATTAVGHLFREDSEVKTYFADVDNMHKVVLEIGTEDELRKLGEDLITNDIKHKLWIEQPENIATCIALKPYEKDAVKKFTRKYKMLK